MHNRARILVIDDDPLFRSLIVSLLRKEYLVSVASEGSEGFYKALEHPPDAAVVDIQMPGWDGLKTLKAFRSHPALQNVKIVILTSDASKETVLAAIHGGANDYIIKTSFAKEEFYQKLSKLLPSKFDHGDPSFVNEQSSVEPRQTADPAPTLPSTEVASTEAVPTITHADKQPAADFNGSPHIDTDDAADDDSRLKSIIDGWE